MVRSGVIKTSDLQSLIDELNAKPRYIVSVTSMPDRESCIYNANEHGEVLDWDAIDCISYSEGDFDWSNYRKIVFGLDEGYVFVKTLMNTDKMIKHLYTLKTN